MMPPYHPKLENSTCNGNIRIKKMDVGFMKLWVILARGLPTTKLTLYTLLAKLKHTLYDLTK